MRKPEAFAIERDGEWWAAVEFVGPFGTNADAWRQVDRNRTIRIDRVEDLQRAVRLLNDDLNELGHALRSPGEFPIRRETAERLEQNILRAVRLLTKIEVE